MEWKLEVVIVPVSDSDRAKRFYGEQMGFTIDHDTVRGTTRIIQATPPGSGCSIVFGTLGNMAPGSLHGLQLTVSDLDAARAEIVGRGVDASEISHFGPEGVTPGRGEPWNNFVFFSDPDGNSWTIQEKPTAG